MRESRLRWREMLPIVGRELRVAAKRRVTYRMRWIVALLGGAQIFIALNLAGPSVEVGHFVFWTTSGVMMLICGAAGLLLTADSISREKRDGTLGLLFLTRLVAADVVLGKLTVGALSGGAIAFAALPFLAFSLSLGGVSAPEFWKMSAALLFVLAYSLVVGIFVSTLLRREGVVSFVFCCVMLAPVAATALAWMKWASVPGAVARWNVFYPAMSVIDVDEVYLSASLVREAVGWQTFTMIAMLGVSFFVLPWTMRVGLSTSGKKIRAPSSRWAGLLRGGKVLERDPVLWLSRRDGHGLVLFVLCVAMYFVVGFAASSASEAEVTFVVLMAFLPKFFVLWQATEGMATERQSGFLETVLTTSLSHGEILGGKMRAIRRHVAPALIFALLVMWHIASKWWGAQGEITIGATLVMAAMIALLIDVHAIGWIGLWQGLVARDRRRALVLAALVGLITPWLPAGFFYVLIGFLLDDIDWVGNPVWLIAMSMISANVVSFGIACFAMARVHEKFRATATQTWATQKN